MNLRKRMLLYLVLLLTVAFVLFTLGLGMYVSNLLAQNNIDSGNWLLFYSIGAGMFLCLLKIAALSLRVTKPLDKMKNAALEMQKGVYTVPTGVKQSDEIGELAAILDDMAQQLSKVSSDKAEAEARRHDFMADISHELRTPITVLRSSLEALRDGVITEPQQIVEYYQEMHAESLYLERLISDLFDLARLQSTEFSFEFEDVCLRDVLRDALRTMLPGASKRGITLPCPDANVFDYIPPIQGDYGRLKQLFIVLLDNAVKFSPEQKEIAVRIQPDGGKLCVTIQDEGSGIALDDLPFIFERFYRTKADVNPTGTGLGLPIAKQIADRHGAEIYISTPPSGGTRVEIIFYP